jgi:hypothetical protein
MESENHPSSFYQWSFAENYCMGIVVSFIHLIGGLVLVMEIIGITSLYLLAMKWRGVLV